MFICIAAERFTILSDVFVAHEVGHFLAVGDQNLFTTNLGMPWYKKIRKAGDWRDVSMRGNVEEHSGHNRFVKRPGLLESDLWEETIATAYSYSIHDDIDSLDKLSSGSALATLRSVAETKSQIDNPAYSLEAAKREMDRKFSLIFERFAAK